MTASDKQRYAPVRHLLPSLLLRGALLCMLWWILSGGSAGSWGVGSAVIVLALALSLKLTPPLKSGFSLTGLIAFIGFFLLQSVRGGAQVAWIALQPRLDLHPYILEIPLRLPAGGAHAALAGTLGLLPGTLAVAIDAGMLRLHVLDRRLHAEDEVRMAEERIAHILKVELR